MKKTQPKPGKTARQAPARSSGSAEFEALLAAIAKTFARSGDCAEAVNGALEEVAGYFGASGATIVPAEKNAKRKSSSALTLELRMPGCEPLTATLKGNKGREWSPREAERFRIAASYIGSAIVCSAARERVRTLEEEQQKIDRALLDAKEWLRMAIDSASIGIWDWDLGTDEVKYLSPLIGGSQEMRASTGAAWTSMTHPDDAPLEREQLDRVLTGQSDSFAMQVRMLGASGAPWRHIRSRGKVIGYTPEGRAARLVGVFEDVTDVVYREQIEREREKAFSHAGRLSSLAALATTVAHELNQPLAALTSYLDASTRLLEKGRPDLAEVRGAIGRSVALAEKASEIVRRLRRLLRREKPIQEPIALPDFLESIRSAMARESRAVGVTVEVDCPKRIVIRGDTVQMEQAVTNLVRNAVEAFGDGHRRPRKIILGARRVDGHVRLTVSDNGPGIDAELQEKVFEPFFTTKAAGTGLGLLIAESIAEVHGGYLALENSGPEGTTFAIAVPERLGKERV